MTPPATPTNQASPTAAPPRRGCHAPARTLRVLALAGLALGTLPACSSPKADPLAVQSERALRQSVIDAASREIAPATSQPRPVVTSREEGVSRLNIPERFLGELSEMAGPQSYAARTPGLGVGLTGEPLQTVTVSLERVVQSTVRNNIAVQFARLGPAIAEAQVVAAEAAFDWTFFTNLNWVNTDSPRTSLGGSPATDQSQSLQGSLGLRRQLASGGRLTLQNDAAYTDVATPGQTANPNPAASSSLSVQWDQPLLRNFGSEVTRAEVRVARNQERDSIQILRGDTISSVTSAERTYWQLVRATQDVLILERLLERGETVQRQLEERAQIDANSAQRADATARVERRRADVLRARTQLRIVSDELKRIMNDPDLPVGGELVLLPADRAVDEPVQFSLAESIRTAIQNRPEVQRAVLAIDDASIRTLVADNLRQPDLSLRLQTRFAALDNELGEAYDDVIDGNFIDYLVGLAFEAPIGNRQREAQFRQRRLERMQSVLAYRNSVQQVVGEVKSALNRVVLNYALIEQTRVSRVAESENVRVLLVEKEQGLGYTVERLDLELSRQERLAQAERDEIDALTEYNIAIADLFAAMGTSLERSNVELVVPASVDEQ